MMELERTTVQNVLKTTLGRRRFLTVTGAAMGLAFMTRLPRSDMALAQPGPFPSYPFTLGVASGDPLPDSVVLWTRLAPNPVVTGEGLMDRRYPIDWRVATDENFTNVVKEGTAIVNPEFAYSAHVDVKGLDAGREYFYQFKSGPELSPVGRTKTAPPAGAALDRFRFAFASCQQHPDGFYNAYRDMAQQDLDLVVHLGDYIYEGAGQGSLGRGHLPAHVILTLDDYRTRHGQYRSDPDLQAAHANFPWIVTWDDHEVTNNYSEADSDPDTPPFDGLQGLEAFIARRANAYRAYWENMPLRQAQMPQGSSLQLYRRLSFGNLVEYNVLDTRQYRSDQINCVALGEPLVNGYCERALVPEQTIMGDEQEQWLLDGLAGSRARWNVLAQQLQFSQMDNDRSLEGQNYVGDGDPWDGYKADRDTILNFVREQRLSNFVVITGDTHRNGVFDLKADFANPQSQTLGAEYMGTSIATGGNPATPVTHFGDPQDPHQRFHNTNRGYVLCDVTPQLWRSDYRIVTDVRTQGVPASTLASFVTENGNPGAQLD
jgi:alkaline phosphatase D